MYLLDRDKERALLSMFRGMTLTEEETAILKGIWFDLSERHRLQIARSKGKQEQPA